MSTSCWLLPWYYYCDVRLYYCDIRTTFISDNSTIWWNNSISQKTCNRKYTWLPFLVLPPSGYSIWGTEYCTSVNMWSCSLGNVSSTGVIYCDDTFTEVCGYPGSTLTPTHEFSQNQLPTNHVLLINMRLQWGQRQPRESLRINDPLKFTMKLQGEGSPWGFPNQHWDVAGCQNRKAVLRVYTHFGCGI